MFEHKISIRNIELFYKTSGQALPTILFLHGNSLSSETFIMQLQNPQLKQFNLIAIDSPGHGNAQWSNNPENDYSLFGLRDAILKLIKKTAIDEFIFAAHSLGEHVAIECLTYLENCNGILLWDTPPVKLPLETSEIFLPNPEISFIYKTDLSDDERIRLAKQLIDGELYKLLSEIIKKSDPQFRSSLSQSLADGKVSDENKILSNSNILIALLHESNDPIINADYLHKLSYLNLWENKMHTTPNTGHSAQMENHKVFNKLLLRCQFSYLL